MPPPYAELIAPGTAGAHRGRAAFVPPPPEPGRRLPRSGDVCAGRLLLGGDGTVQVEALGIHDAIWRTAFAAPGARALVITDDGDRELLDGECVRLVNSRAGRRRQRRTGMTRASTRAAAPVGALRQVLYEAVERLRDDPREAKLHRAVTMTFLHNAPTQQAVADRLGLPFSTYRRHLTRGLQHVCDLLWQRELLGTGGAGTA